MGEDRTEKLGLAEALAHQRLKDLPKDDLPRERFLKLGEQALSDAELLALFFGTGAVGLNVMEMSKLLLARYGGSLNQLSRAPVPELMRQHGVGEAKAIHLAAALAIGRRMAAEQFVDQPMSNAQDVATLLGPQLRRLSQESLRVVLLTARLTLLSVQEIHLGSISEVTADVRDVLRPVIVHGAYAFTVVHNHPSGDVTPSTADRAFTRRMNDVAGLMQTQLLDHIIIGQPSPAFPNGYFSFREHGLLR